MRHARQFTGIRHVVDRAKAAAILGEERARKVWLTAAADPSTILEISMIKERITNVRVVCLAQDRID